MTVNVSSLDIAAWFIWLANDEGKPLTRLPLQKLVTLAQSMYGYMTLDKLYDETIYAFKLGPVTDAVRKTYKDSGKNPIIEPRTGLKELPEDKMAALAELWGLCADVTKSLVEITHQVGPWKKYYNDQDKFIEIPWEEFKLAWPEYRNAILTKGKNRHLEIDRTPGNFMLPASEFGRYDRQIMEAQQHAYATNLTR